MKKIKVIELFAGVGGFRVGLEGFPKKKSSRFEIVWSNQWEPKTPSKQHANWVYNKNFPHSYHNTQDINQVEINKIPKHDMIVAGFPCQDFSHCGKRRYEGSSNRGNSEFGTI